MGANLSRMAFSEKLEKFLIEASKEDLSNVLKQIGFDKSPSQRSDFLTLIKSLAKMPVKKFEETDHMLLDDIDSLKEKIEDCSFDDYYEYYDEEDELGPLKEFVKPFAKILDRAENVFECGDMNLAANVYKKIFQLTQIENDYGHRLELSSVSEIDEDETKARYVRSIYCITPASKRCQVVFALLESFVGYCQYPSIASISEILTSAPPEWDEFLSASIDFLSQKKGNLNDQWLREATLLYGGVEEIAKLAKKDGAKRPKTFVSWLDQLDVKKETDIVVKVCKLGFSTIDSRSPIRAIIADRLEEAADVLGDKKLKKKAIWEGFLVKPELSRLIKARAIGCPMEEANRIAEDFVETEKRQSYPFDDDWDQQVDSPESRADVADVELIHSNIFSGNWENAFRLAKNQKDVGWSGGSSPKALFAVLSLVKQVNKSFSDLPKNLCKVWYNYGSRYYYSSNREEDILSKLQLVYEEIYTLNSSCYLNSSDVKKWVAASVEGRVKHIVSNNHRKAYDRAATIAGAYCEALEEQEGMPKAREWALKVKNWFPRHSAFQREIRSALGSYL